MRRGILSIGTTVVDTVKIIDRLPEKSQVAIVHESSRSVGGNVPNVLIGLAVMAPGLPLQAAAIIGDDEGGNFVVEELKKHGIDAGYMVKTAEASTSFSDVMTLSSTGERTVFYHKGASALLSLEQVKAIQTQCRIVQIAYLGTLGLLEESQGQSSPIAHALKYFCDMGCKTSIDVVSVNMDEGLREVILGCLPHTDYFVVNELEAMALLGLETRTKDGHIVPESLEKAVRQFMDKGVRECAVIHCPETAVYFDKAGLFVQQPSYKISNEQIKGTVGAGDAFVAAFLYSMHEGFSPQDALRYGHASAHFNLQSESAVGGAVSFETIRGFVRNQKS